MSSPESIHTEFIKRITANPFDVYVELSSRLEKNGITTEFPEFAPIVHYMKEQIHTPEINAKCEDSICLMNFRRHADLALWHVSQSDSWYPYGATLRAIFITLQFLDTLQRTVNPELNEQIPFYHEFRYLYYFDYMINKAPHAILIPTYANITASTLVLTRGPPIFFVGISITPLHVDEYKQTSAEFFIHDINHGRRQFETCLKDYETNWANKMSLLNYYKMQQHFLNKLVRPLISISDKTYDIPKGIKQLIKIILFEIIHEDAQPAYERIVCNTILRNANEEANFQVVYKNPETGLPNIRKIKVPGGGILAFVKYKLRYGFLDESLQSVIVEKEYRTTERIAEAASYLLTTLSCDNVPDITVLKELADNMEGQNPPAHEDHLGEPINLIKFTGKRPTSLPSTYFETLYERGVPWSGMKKRVTALEKRTKGYNDREEINAFLKKENAKVATGGTRTRRTLVSRTRKA
jgi:hypothetical protein